MDPSPQCGHRLLTPRRSAMSTSSRRVMADVVKNRCRAVSPAVSGRPQRSGLHQERFFHSSTYHASAHPGAAPSRSRALGHAKACRTNVTRASRVLCARSERSGEPCTASCRGGASRGATGPARGTARSPPRPVAGTCTGYRIALRRRHARIPMVTSPMPTSPSVAGSGAAGTGFTSAVRGGAGRKGLPLKL